MTGSRGTATSGLQAADEANTDCASDLGQDAVGALFEAVVTVNAYGRDVTYEIPDRDHRRGPGPRRTTGPEDARAPRFWLADAERIVIDLTAGGRTCTSDDLRERYADEPSATGAAIGGLFKSMAKRGLLQLVGHCPSTRPEARGRVVGIWARSS